MTVFGVLRIAVAAALFWGLSLGAGAQEPGRWLRAESANFIVYADTNERELRSAVQALEDYDATLRFIAQVTEPPSPNKLEVYLVRRHATLRQLWPGMSTGIRGFYSATPQQVAMFVAYSDAGVMDRREVLFHEYAHHFMLHYFPHAYPAWYVEGFAEYLSTMEFEGRRVVIGNSSTARSYALHAYGLLNIDAMLVSERVRDQTPVFWERFYATSWFATLYIRNRPEYQQGMNRYVEALGEGSDALEAFEPAFGVSYQQFGQELQDFFQRGRIDRYAVRLTDEAAPMTITRLDRSADQLLLRLARLRMMATPEEESGGYLQRAEQIAAEHADTQIARITRARIALLRADTETARAQLQAALSANPQDVEARFLLAHCIIVDMAKANETEVDQAQVQELRRILAQNFRANPNHAPTLYYYAASFSGGPDPLTNDQLDVLARALELAPQASQIRLLLGFELMRAREFNTAIAVLRPIAYAPHDPGSAQQARLMLDSARAGRPLTSWTPVAAVKPETSGDAEPPGEEEDVESEAGE